MWQRSNFPFSLQWVILIFLASDLSEKCCLDAQIRNLYREYLCSFFSQQITQHHTIAVPGLIQNKSVFHISMPFTFLTVIAPMKKINSQHYNDHNYSRGMFYKSKWGMSLQLYLAHTTIADLFKLLLVTIWLIDLNIIFWKCTPFLLLGAMMYVSDFNITGLTNLTHATQKMAGPNDQIWTSYFVLGLGLLTVAAQGWFIRKQMIKGSLGTLICFTESCRDEKNPHNKALPGWVKFSRGEPTKCEVATIRR